MIKKLIEFVKIIVHGGSSHNDEILATSLALASQGDVVPVYRRDPTPEELADPSVLVMDVGGVHDQSKNDFDHHQLDRTAPAACAFTLVAEALGIGGQLEAFFPWYSTWKEIDAKGPFAWSKAANVDWGATGSLLCPVDDLVHDWWEEATGDTPVDPALVARLLAQGKKILGAVERFEDFCVRAENRTLWTIEGVPVLDFSWTTPEESLEFADAYARKLGIEGGVVVSKDNRGPGLALFRRDDDPRIDFSVLDGNPAVTFAHKGGFIAKTVEGAKFEDLVALSVKKA